VIEVPRGKPPGTEFTSSPQAIFDPQKEFIFLSTYPQQAVGECAQGDSTNFVIPVINIYMFIEHYIGTTLLIFSTLASGSF
jgi:hypothetical protein